MSAPRLLAIVHGSQFWTCDRDGQPVTLVDDSWDDSPDEWQCDECSDYFEDWRLAMAHRCGVDE